MQEREKIIDKIFRAQGENGCWKMLPETDKYYPDYLHYVPNFRATLWVLILLADIGHDKDDVRIRVPLHTIKDHFYDPEKGIYSLKEDHFPIPCLNGNIIYLDAYYNGEPGEKSTSALDFFCKNQRFDDGTYVEPKSTYCKNTSCYGKHTCYWGVVKLVKGISFIPRESRSAAVKELLQKCIDFILLHNVYYSSRKKDKIMINKIDWLTFPDMYKSDFLEILWLLSREEVQSENIRPALELLKSKQQPGGTWHLERKMNNLITSVGEINKPNLFVTERAKEVLGYYG